MARTRAHRLEHSDLSHHHLATGKPEHLSDITKGGYAECRKTPNVCEHAAAARSTAPQHIYMKHALYT